MSRISNNAKCKMEMRQIYRRNIEEKSMKSTFRNHSVLMSSSIPQSSQLPSGRYRRMMMGIFFAFSSLYAISNGSVSPSNSTWKHARMRTLSLVITRPGGKLLSFLDALFFIRILPILTDQPTNGPTDNTSYKDERMLNYFLIKHCPIQ